MRLGRGVLLALIAASLVLVACAAPAQARAPLPQGAVHSTGDGHGAPQPAPGPCLQNAARCGAAGSLVASGTAFGTTLLVTGGPLILLALARRVRRARRSSAALPAGTPLTILRPPRPLPVFA